MRFNYTPAYHCIFTFINELVDEMKEAGRTSNANVYKETLVSVRKFSKKKTLYFEEINITFLEKYEVFLRANGGTDGEISNRMRTLRAVFNKAISRGLIKKDVYPFNKYKISKLKGKSAKRALSFEDVQKIIHVDLSEYPQLVNARNYFTFSFHTRGMNFADMMKLKWDDVVDGKIYYTRSKTKSNFGIKIQEPVQKILDYYYKNKIDTDYVFPILLRNGMTPRQIDNRKKKTRQQYNKDLKEIASICKIKKNVTSYVARHSFANCLKQKGVAIDIISESMGHQNVAITQAYLKELDSSQIDYAMDVLL